MKKILVGVLFCLSLVSCSDDPPVVEAVVKESYVLIPSPASSCLAVKLAAGDRPEQDIQASHFMMRDVRFTRENASKDMVISLIKLTITMPNSSTQQTCDIAGDALNALHTDWYSERQAIIRAGTQDFVTDCSLYCGGLNIPEGTTADVLMRIQGFEIDTNGDTSPVISQTNFIVESI